MKNQNDQHDSGCSEYQGLSRRRFLKGTGLAGTAGFTAPAWLPKVAFGAGGGSNDVIIALNNRGAQDGLSFVVPYQDGDYYVNRPNLGIPQPGQTGGAIDLDGFFGLNPAAASLITPYNGGHLAIFHAAGSTDPTRSHFDGITLMDGGVPGQEAAEVDSGWLARHLLGVSPTGAGDLRAMALADTMPTVLQGVAGAIPAADPAGFGFPGRAATEMARRRAIQMMYARAAEPLASASVSTLASIDLLQSVDFAGYVPEGGAVYPNSPLGQQLRSSAIMIKAGIGLEAVAIDAGGWDHHNAQGPQDGLMAMMLSNLAAALEAFYLDLSPGGWMNSTTLVMMSEFGRRVAENVSLGTDHGHGNVMMVMSGNTTGGIHGVWPGLAPGQLDQGLDLAITTDYRDVVGEVLQNRGGNTNLADVFPDHTFSFPGVTT